MQLEIFSDIKNILGEGPCWSDHGFTWVDILGKKLWLQDDKGTREVFSNETEMPSSVAFDDQGELIFTLNDGFYRVVDGELKSVHLLEGAGQGAPARSRGRLAMGRAAISRLSLTRIWF